MEKGSIRKVKVVEVGPRDGLQNEVKPISTEDKVVFIDMLGEAGFSSVEVTSFVRPDRIPQLADAQAVYEGIQKRSGVEYTALVPNRKGLDNALAAGVKSIAVFTGATEGFTQSNINMTIEQSLARFEDVVAVALSENISVRAYLSVCFGCPYEGNVEPQKVVEIASRLIDMGCGELSIGDTTGVGVPDQVEEIVSLLGTVIPLEKIALHLHDTRGTALANVMAAMKLGVSTFDSSAAGLGGCPYAPGAPGNLATEDLLYMLHGMGVETGIDLDKVVEASAYVSKALGFVPPGRYYRAAISKDRSEREEGS